MIVNGQRNKVVLDIVNKEKTPYTVFAVTGQVSNADDYTKVVRNVSRPRGFYNRGDKVRRRNLMHFAFHQLTATRYGKALEAGKNLQIPYNFYSEFAPGEHGLTVFVDLLVDVSTWYAQITCGMLDIDNCNRKLSPVLLATMVPSLLLNLRVLGLMLNCK